METDSEYEQMEREDDKILSDFSEYLVGQKKFSLSTANRHLDNIGMFAYSYLLEYEARSIQEADAADIFAFLSDWYLRKVLGTKKADIKSYLTSFKKFFAFLHARGRITSEQLEEIKEECNDPAKYITYYEEYLEHVGISDPLDYLFEDETGTEGTRHEQEPQGYKKLLGISFPAEMPFKSAVINGIGVEKCKSLPVTTMTFLDDFSRLLDYCLQHDGMKLSSQTVHFGTTIVREMNALLHEPEPLRSTAKQPDSVFIHPFYLVARKLDLFNITANLKLQISPNARQFKELPKVEQFITILNAFWNKINWIDLNNGFSGRPEWAQKSRKQFSSFLQSIEPGYNYNYANLLNEKHAEIFNQEHDFDSPFDDWQFKFGVFPERVIPALKTMGLLDFQYAKPLDSQFRDVKYVDSLEMTPFGKIVFDELNKPAAEGD